MDRKYQLALLAVAAAGLLASCATTDDTAESKPIGDEVAAEATSTTTTTTSTTTTTTTTTTAPTTTTVLATPVNASSGNDIFAVGAVDSIQLPPGDPGVVSVIVSSAPDRVGRVGLVVRNNTPRTVTGVTVAASARDGAGALIASAEANNLLPSAIAPGHFAIGYVSFVLTPVPPGTPIEFTVRADDGPTKVPVSVTEANVVDGQYSIGSVLGTITADTAVSGPIPILALCFDATGTLTTVADTYADLDPLAAGQSSPFSSMGSGVNASACAVMLVSAAGYPPR